MRRDIEGVLPLCLLMGILAAIASGTPDGVLVIAVLIAVGVYVFRQR